jgi:hypothetical protein
VTDIIRYFVFPHPLVPPDTANLVAVLPAWRTSKGTYLCGETLELEAMDIRMFPGGGAIISRKAR